MSTRHSRSVRGRDEEGQSGEGQTRVTRSSSRKTTTASDLSDDPEEIVNVHLTAAGTRLRNANMLVRDISKFNWETSELSTMNDKLNRVQQNKQKQRANMAAFASSMIDSLQPVKPGVNFYEYSYIDGDDLVNSEQAQLRSDMFVTNTRSNVMGNLRKKLIYTKNAEDQLAIEKKQAQDELLAANEAEDMWRETKMREDEEALNASRSSA